METFHALKQVLRAKGYSTAVGDEGGFAPDLKSTDEGSICLDPAASEMWDNGTYTLFKSSKKSISSQELVKTGSSCMTRLPVAAPAHLCWNVKLAMEFATRARPGKPPSSLTANNSSQS